MKYLEDWKNKAVQLKRDVYALYLARSDPRIPWYARVLALCVAGYAFSPIDLIPDFIPVLGYLDDLLLVPLGIWLAVRLIPGDVMQEYREKAAQVDAAGKPRNWTAAALIIVLWLVAAWLGIRFFFLRK